MKVIIAGNRFYSDWEAFKSKVSHLLKNVSDIEIVSGCCEVGTVTFCRLAGIDVCGADGMGERYANLMRYPVKHFPADWSKGKSGGPIRNKQMVDYVGKGGGLIAFFNRSSKVTKDIIQKATKAGLKVKVVKF